MWRRFIFGSPLATSALEHARLTKLRALPIFASDALSSVAYATEEILLVLVVGGSAILWLSTPIAIGIAVLIGIVALSYWQTIQAYPSGGGAFIVAHDNLGITAGLVAAGALLIDYSLTVAVSVAAGIRAITSTAPGLAPYALELSLLLAIVLITWANLRGLRESAGIFAIPSYLFILLVLVMVSLGGWHLLMGVERLEPLPAPPVPAEHALTIFLILRAFSSGCAALTGIEAISNGVSTFRQPAARNAGITLIVMAVLLVVMFLGITFLVHALNVVPQEDRSVLSIIAHTVFGGGTLYYILQAATAMILLLAANTAFAGFPVLASILAKQRYLPVQLSNRGERLAFSNGILALAAIAMGLVILFGADTHHLVLLYAVGVFVSFTLSQFGMVVRWLRCGGPGWQVKALTNGVGAAATATALAVIIES